MQIINILAKYNIWKTIRSLNMAIHKSSMENELNYLRIPKKTNFASFTYYFY